ncbi:unnamed protein product [Spirodela intermedia]|uniref:Uncharacterized protein n=1 Tax=Spirodela intermedia TaxID=51605 RepID=A0A7I8IGB0_SPIIN|nr:unnamed protein product [Spirodela intermedia]CAA6656909.1 unnamed protein product [Spirodela intermedia]
MADASAKFLPGDLLTAAAAAEAAAAHDGLIFWQFMVAGSVAGIVEHTAMFPVDTLKTRMQQAQVLRRPPETGLRRALAAVVRAEGPLALYRGVAAMALGAGPAHAVYFSVYEVSKEFLLAKGSPSGGAAAHAAAGVAATVASDAVFTPMDTVKQRLQLKNSPYRGVADCVGRIVREEGFRGLYASYRTTVLMNAPFTAVHFATYEAAKRGLSELSPQSAGDERLVVHATAGAAAGALAAAVTTPLDVAKTQLQCQSLIIGLSSTRTGSLRVRQIFHQFDRRGPAEHRAEGWPRRALKGLKPRMLFHAPAAAICWSTYESSKSFFQDLNDGKRPPCSSS